MDLFQTDGVKFLLYDFIFLATFGKMHQAWAIY